MAKELKPQFSPAENAPDNAIQLSEAEMLQLTESSIPTINMVEPMYDNNATYGVKVGILSVLPKAIQDALPKDDNKKFAFGDQNLIEWVKAFIGKAVFVLKVPRTRNVAEVGEILSNGYNLTEIGGRTKALLSGELWTLLPSRELATEKDKAIVRAAIKGVVNSFPVKFAEAFGEPLARTRGQKNENGTKGSPADVPPTNAWVN